MLIDVRASASSRKYPHFVGESLAECLKTIGITYKHRPQLGGVPNGGPRGRKNGFPGQRALEENREAKGIFVNLRKQEGKEVMREILDHIGKGQRTCLMCAEERWVECHRQVIATELQKEGIKFHHIDKDGGTEQHPCTIKYENWLLSSQGGESQDALVQDTRNQSAGCFTLGKLPFVEREGNQASDMLGNHCVLFARVSFRTFLLSHTCPFLTAHFMFFPSHFGHSPPVVLHFVSDGITSIFSFLFSFSICFKLFSGSPHFTCVSLLSTLSLSQNFFASSQNFVLCPCFLLGA